MSEIMKSELNTFGKLNYQMTIEKSSIIQIRPTTALNEGSTIEFTINGSGKEYIDLQNIFIWIKGKVTKPDGTNFAAGEDNQFSMVNYGLNTMWDQCDIFLNGVLISQSSNTHHYRSFIEVLTNYSAISSSTFLRSGGFILQDPAAAVNSINAYLSPITNQSREFTLYGRLHGDIFNCDRLLMNNVEMRIVLNKAKFPLCMMIAENAAHEPKIKLNDVVLYVRKVQLDDNYILANETILQMNKAIYLIKRTVVKELNLPAGQKTFVLDNVFMGQMPERLIIGIVTHAAASGDYKKDPFAFENNSLVYIQIHRNGESFPVTAYEPDYANNKYEREYYDFFLNQGATQTESAPNIQFADFKKIFCLYNFNFNADFDNPKENEYINVLSNGFINIELKFAANLVAALKCIVYAKFNNVIEIDSNRNVTVDY